MVSVSSTYVSELLTCLTLFGQTYNLFVFFFTCLLNLKMYVLAFQTNTIKLFSDMTSKKLGLDIFSGRVCRSHVKNAAGYRPSRIHSQQEERFQNIQTRAGNWVGRPLARHGSSGDLSCCISRKKVGLAGKVRSNICVHTYMPSGKVQEIV